MLRWRAMKIRYGGRAAAISLGGGIAAIVWTPVMASIALGTPALVFGPITLLGAVMALAGVLLTVGRTYVTIDSETIVIHALVGPIKRRFPFASWRDVELVANALSIAGRRVPIHRTQANADDWHDFERFVAARTVGSEVT